MSFINKAIDYLRSSKNELTKVTWPSKQETTRYSIMVITISLGVAVFFGVMDYGLGKIMNATLANANLQSQTEQTVPITPDVAPSDIQVDAVPTDPAGEQPKFEFDSVDAEPVAGAAPEGESNP